MKIYLVGTLCVLFSVQTLAIRERLSREIYTSFHGEGLPKKVGKVQIAIDYRERFKNAYGITSFIDELGLTQYRGNEIGLALLKRGNNDAAFFNILSKRDYQEMDEWRNGPQFLKSLKNYTKDNGCISKITSLSHGWASGGRPGEGSGLSGNRGMNGLYATDDDLPGFIARLGARSLNKDLREDIEKGDVKFCNLCVVQFYSCNLSAKFAKSFAQVSGCQVALATGQNSPYFQSLATEQDKEKVYEGSHYWKSGAGVWAERHTDEQKARGERLGSWYRATPIKNLSGNVTGISEENLGELYIAL